MIKKLSKISVILLLMIVSCSKEEEKTGEELIIITEQQEPLTGRQINDFINSFNQAGEKFDWSKATTHQLWSAVVNGNNLVSIGFGANLSDFDKTKSPLSVKMQTEIINLIIKYEGNTTDLIVSQDDYLNLIDVVIKKQETLEALRKNRYVRYVEPADYRYFSFENQSDPKDGNQVQSDSGCGYGSSTISSADFTTISPNAQVPWAFYKHGIPNAWSYSSGSGITIGVVDSGLSSQQSLMGSSFNSGLSSGRYVQRYGTYVDSIWPWSTSTDGVNDLCGHGTSMASAATAPRNGNGLPVGVAYNANLVTYRASSDVVLNGYHEQNGVKNAFTALGNRSDVKIISMSMGHIFSVGKITDGVRYAKNRGKLIFCAGGTSTSFTNFVGVIFPAWLSETVAVTGIKEASTYQKCDVCHSGSEIDFTIMMQRSGSNNTIPVLSYYNNQADYVGGSSVATATTAGIAALVWSKNPTWTSSQVLTKMKQSSQFYPTKNSQYGHGIINALTAVQ
jgi:serine protease